MVRISVYKGFEKDADSGLTLLNFDVLNELEETGNKIKNFQLVGRFNKWKEPLMEDRIYFVNIVPNEKGKAITDYEILDKSKFLTHEDGRFFISYRKYSGKDLINFYEEGVNENRKNGKKYNDPQFNLCQAYINHCLTQKKGSRLYFNTFTKYMLERIFNKYGYSNVVHYKTKKEKGIWSKEITQKVKNFVNEQNTENSDWSNKEIEYLTENIKKPEKDIAKALNRTVPAVATMKWKLRHESRSVLNKPSVKNKPEDIASTIKTFRKENNLNQKDLSKQSGVSVSVISQLECSKYISTDSQIVDDLLDYISKEGGVVNVGGVKDVPEVKQLRYVKKNYFRKPALTETVGSDKDDSVVDEEIDDVYVMELISEVKYMNIQLSKIHKKLNEIIVIDTKNPGKVKTTIKLTNKPKELHLEKI